MTKQMLLCLTNSPLQAHQVVDWLKQEGFPARDISACVPERTPGKRVEGSCGEAQESSGTEEVSGAHITVAGKTLVRSARVGSNAFVKRAGLADLLVARGLPESAARDYEGHLKEGGILISVHTASKTKHRRAKEIMQLAGTQSIAETQMKGRPMLRLQESAA